jgi:ubiquinone/menaquinone biosynthesis C-methylase UbiE
MTVSPGRRYLVDWFTPFTLSFYELYVIRVSLPLFWGCSEKKHLGPLFSKNFSKRHLDIGVGDGHFPTRALKDAGCKPESQHITLADFSENCLAVAKRRILSHYPEVDIRCVLADAGKPFPDSLQNERFDSASLFLIMHHMPGPTHVKTRAITNAKNLLTREGTLTGCTVLGTEWEKADQGYKKLNERPSRRLASFMLGFYNKRGMFDNWQEDPNVIEKVLQNEFEEVETQVVSMMFIFRARKPRA